ncbi:MAG: hypothetical protein CEO21_308 [Microgenomates group bacterium Gr01-1014_80]|nr:MAG: hypothetical protein CEO21_308 [Microgenomates group bacterium Gr01-1014_80]
MKQKGNALSEWSGSKGFAPVLIVLIVAAAAGYFVYTNYLNSISVGGQNQARPSETVQATQIPIPSPTPDPHPDWKKYSNNELGYSFRVPQNWLINTFQNNGDYNRGFSVVNEKDQEMFVMYDSPSPYNIFDIDPSIIVKKSFQIGKDVLNKDCYDNKQAFILCENIDVTTSSGKKFTFEIKDINLTTIEVLKTVDGLIVIHLTPTPAATGTWRIYEGDGVSFEYLASWKKQPDRAFFNSRDGVYSLKITSNKNYDDKTGKSYSSIKELVDDGIKIEDQPDFKKITIDGQEAWQVSERKLYEDTISILFFSKDLKNIFTIEFRTYTEPDKLNAKVEVGQTLLNHTISTFRFD